MVIVHHNGGDLMLKDIVAHDLGYRGGEDLTEAQTWEAARANAAAGIASCKLGMIQKEGSK